MIQDKIGVNIKGVAKTGFITIGKPKSTGSLILKMAGTISRRGYVAGKSTVVELKVEYKDIFSAIRTITRNNILIARRCRFGMTSVLRLTGTGYHRTRRKTGGTT